MPTSPLWLLLPPCTAGASVSAAAASSSDSGGPGGAISVFRSCCSDKGPKMGRDGGSWDRCMGRGGAGPARCSWSPINTQTDRRWSLISWTRPSSLRFTDRHYSSRTDGWEKEWRICSLSHCQDKKKKWSSIFACLTPPPPTTHPWVWRTTVGQLEREGSE